MLFRSDADSRDVVVGPMVCFVAAKCAAACEQFEAIRVVDDAYFRRCVRKGLVESKVLGADIEVEIRWNFEDAFAVGYCEARLLEK